jgi:hypothetical protein
MDIGQVTVQIWERWYFNDARVSNLLEIMSRGLDSTGEIFLIVYSKLACIVSSWEASAQAYCVPWATLVIGYIQYHSELTIQTTKKYEVMLTELSLHLLRAFLSVDCPQLLSCPLYCVEAFLILSLSKYPYLGQAWVMICHYTWQINSPVLESLHWDGTLQWYLIQCVWISLTCGDQRES